ncbi:hypothetical protein CF65_01068 [Aggregatibacter actinomycetemcomitans HK1651]|nr:hypothetical protein CF65_01068 [Aggregatibacter actinomycetemcomitans HK1651]
MVSRGLKQLPVFFELKVRLKNKLFFNRTLTDRGF